MAKIFSWWEAPIWTLWTPLALCQLILGQDWNHPLTQNVKRKIEIFFTLSIFVNVVQEGAEWHKSTFRINTTNHPPSMDPNIALQFSTHNRLIFPILLFLIANLHTFLSYYHLWMIYGWIIFKIKIWKYPIFIEFETIPLFF